MHRIGKGRELQISSYKEILHNSKIREFIRFCVVGVLSTCIHYAIYLALLKVIDVEDKLWVTVLYSIGYVVGFVFNLFMSAFFTFKTTVTIQRSLGFVVTNVINYGLHIAFLNIFLWLSIPDQWAPIPTFCCVIPINFILVRTVFKKLK